MEDLGAWILIAGFIGFAMFAAYARITNEKKRIDSYDDIAEIKETLKRNSKK